MFTKINLNKVLFALTLLIILIHRSKCQLKNCSKLVEILYNGKQSYIGNLTLISLERLSGVSIELIFEEPIKSLSTDFGRTSTRNRMNFIIKDDSFIWESDTYMSIIFEVRYGKNIRIPSMKSVILNENLKCSSNENMVKEVQHERPQKIDEVPTTSSEISTTEKPQKNAIRNQKSKFTIPLSELKNKKLIRIIFDRNVLSLTSDIGEGKTSNNRTFEINIEEFDTNLYEFEKKQEKTGIELYFSYNINHGIPKIVDLMYVIQNEVDIKSKPKSNDTSSQEPRYCFYVDSRESFSGSKVQEWSFSIEIPSDLLLLESNSFEVSFDRMIKLLSSSKGKIERKSSRKFIINFDLEKEVRLEKYVNLVFTTQSKSNCEDPKLLEFSINKKPYCVAIVKLSENQNSNPTKTINNTEMTHYVSDCLQLKEVIDNQGNWKVSLQIPPTDSPNGLKIFLLFDKDVQKIQSNYGEISSEDNRLYTITGIASRTFNDGPLMINMTLKYLKQEGFPEFINVMVGNTVYCVTRAKLITYSPAFISSFMSQCNKVESDSQRCIKYIEMISDDGYWNATLLVPSFESFSGSQVQMVFDRNLISLTNDFAETYTFDYKTFISYNTIPRRFQDGPLEIKLNFIYDGYKGLPDLLKVFVNSLQTCVDRTLLSYSNFENSLSSTTASSEIIPSTTPITIIRTSTANTKQKTTESDVDFKEFESYFQIVSSKYNPGNVNIKSTFIDKNNQPANTDDSVDSPIVFSTIDGQGCVCKIILAENPFESGLGQKNVYLHLHFPSIFLNFDHYDNDSGGHKHLFLGPHLYSPFENDKKLESQSRIDSKLTFEQTPIKIHQREGSPKKNNVPSIESLKNLGKQNIFYNYFGDSQYITFAVPPHGQSPSFDDLIVANLRSSRTKNQEKMENPESSPRVTELQQQSKYSRHSSRISDITSKKKLKGFFMPKLALFVKSSQNL